MKNKEFELPANTKKKRKKEREGRP